MDSMNADSTLPVSQPETDLHNDEMEIQADHQNVEVNARARRLVRGPKRKSKVWRFFVKYKEGGKNKARCRKCNFVYTNYGTTNLIRHVKELCPLRVANGISFGDEVEFDQGIFRKKIADAVVTHNLPFRKIRDVFSYLNPNVEVICRNTGKVDILDMYNDGKEELKRILETMNSRVCLTSDLWTSITSTGYMTLAAQYVDESWVLRCKLLVFRQLPPTHDGQSIGENLINLLQEWVIEKKIFTLTLDNASYYDSAVDMLKNHLTLQELLLHSELNKAWKGVLSELRSSESKLGIK